MNRALETLYEQIGGMHACQRLSELFHERIAGDPLLREVFPNDLTAVTERLALFLAERLGGPAEYTARRGKNSLLCRHAHVPIGSGEVAAWLGHIFAALDAASVPDPARQLLRDYFTETAHTLSDPFHSLYRLPLDELQALLQHNPQLATTSHLGLSLLREAAGRWDLPRVQMLLAYGADVNVKDRLDHDPLSRAAGAKAPELETKGRAIVELLIQHGANVNTQSGPERVTPLHSAARRGTVAIAEMLLNLGAELEAKDTKGETPLRRAVNCGQEGMVLLLLSHRADPLNPDKQGRTALAAARHERIRQALQQALRTQSPEEPTT